MPASGLTQSGSTRRWRETRRRHLHRNPWCYVCGGTATEVHHVIQRVDGGTDHDSNLRSLCKPCHQKQTAAQTRQRAAELKHLRLLTRSQQERIAELEQQLGAEPLHPSREW
ncbi:MAG TPA: HNH endonuclease [Solirubrobacteraceae bacterium]|jgi:5-methylcytosine-specific restriction protein A|nr:HNH endonuclease [Solirubrobacteraceae bacterium]